jgi:hypothetical protein
VTVAARDAAFMARYLDDFRFLLRQLGTHPAILHVEPDFWGYAQHAARAAGTNASGLPAAVASANAADCAGYPDTIAELGRCLVPAPRISARPATRRVRAPRRRAARARTGSAPRSSRPRRAA